jgi:hypothetical protein
MYVIVAMSRLVFVDKQTIFRTDNNINMTNLKKIHGAYMTQGHWHMDENTVKNPYLDEILGDLLPDLSLGQIRGCVPDP